MMDLHERVEFRHRHLDDPFIMYGNLAFSLFRNWGAAMFFLMVAGVPAAIAFTFAISALGVDPGAGTLTELAVGAWLGSSAPIAVFGTWIRARRLKLNRMAVGPEGIEYRLYPWREMNVPWKSVRDVRNTSVPDEDISGELVIQASSGRIVIEGEDWHSDRIETAIARHFPITRNT
jgi:hypothetical protein